MTPPTGREPTDLELVRVCAKAMGLAVWKEPLRGTIMRYWFMDGNVQVMYDPLHDDAQCMALLVAYRLLIELNPNVLGRRVRIGGSEVEADIPPDWENYAANLRRAICLAVYRLQSGRGELKDG